jgi:hypothetical protein
MLKSIKHLVKSSNLSHTLFHVSGSFTYNIAHKMTVAAAVIFVRQHRTESNGQFPSVSSPFLAAAELSPQPITYYTVSELWAQNSPLLLILESVSISVSKLSFCIRL